MANDPTQPGDDAIIALAAAERDAGVPDVQTAAAAAAAEQRSGATDEAEAHPS